jgi:transcription antitermination protein NusB
MSAEMDPAPRPPRGRGGLERRQARDLAYQTLYETDLSHHRPGEVLQRRLDEGKLEPELAEFARELVAGVLQHRTQVDRELQAIAAAWPLEQMSAIDRNILRIGIYDCLYTSERVPMRVAINEAVELAKRYGSDSAPRFVNGVLGQLVRTHQLDDQPPAATP